MNKIPFSVKTIYTCILRDKRTDDVFFELGKKYKCVYIKDPHKYNSNLYTDNSSIKFISENGTVVSYFGSIAEKHFF